MSFTVCKSGAYGLCNMDPFIEISLIIKYTPQAHFRVCKAPEDDVKNTSWKMQRLKNN